MKLTPAEELWAMNPSDPLSRAPNHMELHWREAGWRRLQWHLHVGRVSGSCARQLTHSPWMVSLQQVFEPEKEPKWNNEAKKENTWKCYFEAYGTWINEHINYSIIYGILNILSSSPLLPLCYDSIPLEDLSDFSERRWNSSCPGCLSQALRWTPRGDAQAAAKGRWSSFSLSCLHNCYNFIS